MTLWEVKVVSPPEGDERKGWERSFVVLAENAVEAAHLVRKEQAWVFAGAARSPVQVEEYEGRVVVCGTRRVTW